MHSLQSLPVDMDTMRVERFSIFHGILRIAGYAFSHEDSVETLDLHLPGIGVFPITNLNLPSPELTLRHGAAAAACRFAQDIQFGWSDPLPDYAITISAKLRSGRVFHHRVSGSDPDDQGPSLYLRFFAMLAERCGGKLLEIGARARTGDNARPSLPPGWTHIGLDIVPHNNVDVVADAHECSRFLPLGEFDAVLSMVVFEHLLMPWKVCVEMNRVMKKGAVGLVVAPEVWPEHELPCDYFRFSAHSWKALLNRATGFEILDIALGPKTFIVPRMGNAPHLHFGERYFSHLISTVLFRKIGESRVDWPVSLKDISEDVYPG